VAAEKLSLDVNVSPGSAPASPATDIGDPTATANGMIDSPGNNVPAGPDAVDMDEISV
jgi:hypothetical protein